MCLSPKASQNFLTGHYPEHVRHPSQRQRFAAKHMGFQLKRDSTIRSALNEKRDTAKEEALEKE